MKNTVEWLFIELLMYIILAGGILAFIHSATRKVRPKIKDIKNKNNII